MPWDCRRHSPVGIMISDLLWFFHSQRRGNPSRTKYTDLVLFLPKNYVNKIQSHIQISAPKKNPHCILQSLLFMSDSGIQVAKNISIFFITHLSIKSAWISRWSDPILMPQSRGHRHILGSGKYHDPGLSSGDSDSELSPFWIFFSY
jgi:hypothetical protein